MMSIKSARRQAGFTLTEIMVGLLIGMITVLVILTTLANSEAVRRSVSSGSDAVTVGSVAAQVVQRELLNTGFGSSVDDDLFQICGANGVAAYNMNRVPSGITLAAGDFAPVRILRWDDPALPYPQPDQDTDVIQVLSSGASTFLGKGVEVQGAGAASSNFTITSSSSRAGLRMGDLFIAAPCTATPSSTAPCVADAGKNCLIAQVTDLPFSVGANNECNVASVAPNSDRTIRHDSATFKDAYEACADTPPAWNKAGDSHLGIGDFSGAKLYSIGPPSRFVLRAYAIRGGNLTACDPLLQNCDNAGEWQRVAENIVSLRAQYGYDASGNGNVEAGEWVRALPANPVWVRLKAVRFSLVSRGSQIDRNVVSTDCTPDWAGVTNANATCAGLPLDGEIYLSSAPDGLNWARYRYKVFQTTTPLRNLYWSDNLL